MRVPPQVAFVFASRGIGGAERSMLRLMARAHPAVFRCRVIVPARENRPLRAAVSALGIPYHALSPGDALGWLRLLRAERPDVLYVFGRFRTVAWAALARVAGVRCVVAAERSAANRWTDRVARALDRPLVAAYVANSELAARNLRAFVGADGPPVRVVPNGIERGGVLAGDGRAGDSLLCVGSITPNKGQGVLLEAVRLLRPRYPELRATLVGRDGTGGRFFRRAAARGLDDTYTAVGFVDDVRLYLARARVVVLPTLHREGMPTALLEAMRAGVPVVASDVGGVSEIVEDGSTGLLVPPGDARALATAISRLLEDEATRVALARNARQRVLDRHDLSVMVEGHRAAFEDALARVSARRAPGEAAPLVPRGRGLRALAGGPARVAHVTTADGSLRYLLLDQLLAIRERGYDVTGVSSPGREAAFLEGLGIRHEAVAMTRRLTPFADLRSLAGLYRLMRRRRFTIVHAHNPKPGLLAQVAARLAGVPVVVNTVHGFYFHDRMRPAARSFYTALERIAARCSDLILSQNEEDLETARREGIAPPPRILLLGNGIDLERFDPARIGPESRRRTRAALGIAPDAPVVGFVGRLVEEKGVRELLEAARVVTSRVRDARFLVVGDADPGKPDRLTLDAARSLDPAGACVFAGFRQDMPELYHSMDVFALPSHREGFPRAPMEASAMRVPCVVTDVRGCRQAVRHGGNGLTVPVGNALALADAILALLADPGLARRLGEEGRRRALLEFDQRRVFATVLAEYERLLEAKALRGRIPAAAEPGLARAAIR
ncbi:MAG TPA: glycosyltransferase [Vicinamibacteria bacterium]|nr:glycosyltransferase [Vicinamibacteria bacterium]